MATDHNFKVKKGLDVLGGNVNLADGFAYKIDGTTVVDSSRNLTNIPSIRLTNEGDAALTSTAHAFQIGPTSGYNLIIDNNEIMARYNGSASTLYIQNDGGTVHIGANVSTNLQVDGNIKGVTGNTTGKFAVMSTAVHASYDFYNNGTTYLNGTTEVNAEFKISSSSSYITHFNYQDNGINIISQANAGSTSIRNNNGTLFTLSGAGSLSVVGNVIAGNSSTAAIVRSHYSDGSYMTLEGFGLVMNRGASYIRPSTNADKTLYIGGADSSLNWASVRFRAGSGLYLNGTQFIDASRNLTNIGTISSGAITIDPSGMWGTGIVVNAGDNNTAGGGAKQLVLSYGGTTSTDFAHSIRTRHDGGAAATNTIEFWLWNYGTDSSSTLGTLRSTVINPSGVDVKSGGYLVGGTTVIDSSRNLTNIGTISSGAITSSSDISANGYLQAYSYLYTRSDLRVLNAAGTGWNTWGSRSNGTYNLSVGTISSGVITAEGTSGGTNLSYASNFAASGASIQLTLERTGSSTGWGGIGADATYCFSAWGGSGGVIRRFGIGQSGNADLLYGDYKINGTTVIDSSRNLTNIGSLALSSSITLNNNQRIYFKNSSGTSSSFLYRPGGNATRFQYADNAFIFDAASDTDFEIRQSGDAVVFKVDVQSTVANTSVYTTGNFNAAQNIQTNGTTRITSVGNLTNIGSITASGNLQAQNATFTGTGDVTVKIIADTDNVTEGDNPTLGFSQDGNTAGTLFVLGLEGNENTVFQGSKVNAPYIHANVGSDNHPLSIGNNSKLVAQFNSTAASPALTITKFSNITGTNGSTILNLKNYMGSSTTDGDLSQQKSFIDFQMLDSNANEVPQVRIGAEVGEGGDANTQYKEGSGAFVVYTNDADTDGSSSIDAGSSLTEKFRVAHDGTSTFTNNVVIGGNLTVNGTQTTLNTATLQVEDKNIVLNYGTGDTSGSADGAGITIQDAVSGSSDAAMTWNAASDYFNFSHKINIQGDLQSYNVYAQDYHVLNDAGTGWHEWATRSDNRVNLSVHDISFNGVARSTNNANVDGPNFNVSTTNKSTSEYAYRVDRSGTVVGGIRIDGRLIGPEATINGSSITSTSIGNWNTAYGWGNHASAGYLTASSTQSKYLRSDADDTFTGNLTSGNNNWIRFVAANATDTNDGKIGAGVFATGLNIVGAQTSAGTGRQVRIWGDLLDSAGNAFVKNNANITTGTITVGTTTDSSKITFPDKNVSDNPTASGDKRQLIAMGNSGGGGMWQTTGRGGLMLASADDSLILASGDVGRGHDPDAGGWNPNPDDENIYLLTDSAIYFRTNLQTVSDYKQMSFDANGDLAVARNISASNIKTSGATRIDSTGNLTNIGSITASGNVQHTGLTMTSGTDIDQLYTASQTLTITTTYADTGIDASDLATGTYLVQLQCNDHSVGGAYSMIYSGVMSWANNDTNDTAVDEIPLHRAGHASVGKNLFLRVQYTVSSDVNNLKLQIRGNYNASGSSTYTFKFRRMI